jgi:stage III sporulation protein AH
MVFYVCEPKKIIKTGIIVALLLFGGWLLVQGFRPEKKEQPPVNVEVDMNAQEQDISDDVQKEEFFVDCRLTRDRIRSQQIDVLKEIAANTSSSSEIRDQAQEGLMKLTERSCLETELEKLVTAQGFKDAVVMIQDTAVNVIIQQDILSSSETEEIRDVVVRVTSLKPEGVFITCRP